MEFLTDPSALRLGAASVVFLVVVCVLLPVAAVRQHRQLAQEEQLRQKLSRMRIYASAVATHVVLLVMVWSVVREQRLDLFPPYRPTLAHVLIAVGALAIGLLPLLDRLRTRDAVAEERIRLIAPRTARERVVFVGVAISAGFSEELAYRGVLFLLLASLVDSWWIAALIGAGMFGIAHSFQGWKSSGIAALIGLRDQIVVGLTGTLIYAIAVHAIHDMIAGAVISRRVRREEAVSQADVAIATY